jgi:hypothetical protein
MQIPRQNFYRHSRPTKKFWDAISTSINILGPPHSGELDVDMPAFKPRDRKHRHRRQDGKAAAIPADTNAAEIVPASKAEKEAKRQQLRDQLRDQQPKMSSKKKKRLDKYIVRVSYG